MTIGEIIDLLGGPTPVAVAMKIPPTTVSNWKARKCIPPRYHAAFLEFADGKVTAQMLVDAYGKEPATEKADA